MRKAQEKKRKKGKREEVLRIVSQEAVAILRESKGRINERKQGTM